MRENKCHFGTGWIAKELFGEDFYSSKGNNSWEDTVELRVKSTVSLIEFIQAMNVKKFLVMNSILNGFYEYLFAYVPVGIAEDFCGSLANEMKRINERRGIKEATLVPTRPDFQKMYREFEDKYNPYPVQMSRYDAFGHALRDGLITKEVYDQAREFYRSLWNYVGD